MGQLMSSIDFEVPILLLAMPQVMDPFFNKSVVLLLHHNDEGGFGFIVNRPTEIHLADILQGMEISWQGAADSLAFFGGPVQSQLGTVMFDQTGLEIVDFEPDEGLAKVCPGVVITQQLEDLGRLAATPPSRFRLLLGYAGWGAGQLVSEIVRNDWLMAPVRDEFLFAEDPDTVWESALESVGIDPASLPSWTPNGGQEPTN
jgi:putative transcriptional regulator